MPEPSTSLITEDDLFLWNEGTHYRLYEKLGAHHGPEGTQFAVWAPNAESVSVIGDWNRWEPAVNEMKARGVSGIWECWVPGDLETATYKYRIVSRDGKVLEKADPFGFHHETPPNTGSKVWDLSYTWGDDVWMKSRADANSLEAPISVYEVHLGSWRRGEEGRYLTYREMAEQLPDYIVELGFTHVELLPVMEHPFYGSWGYQTTGYFAPSSRFGTPQDFMALIDAFHQSGIGVILDWVPSHFPEDAHGLANFDGTHLFEHADPRQGFHPDWKSLIFNYGRSEVPAFLISSAMFWLDRFHIDGIRVDAVASMLYLDYSRQDGEWIPNEYGGRENLEAIAFLKRLNEVVYSSFPDTQTIAEESTAWPMVSKPTYVGGLGFGMKWDMGWMHDTLEYMSKEPVYRQFHHHELTFRGIYAFTENFMLPLSHDEVVHGKRSLLEKMPGDDWQKFANLRLLLSYMFTQPGKKLLFMGVELAQRTEWAHDGQLDWVLSGYPSHAGVSRLVGDLNRMYRESPALHRADADSSGFEWAVANDSTNSVFAYFRRFADEEILFVANMTPVPRHDYRIGVSAPGRWVEVLNTDAPIYGGSGEGNLGEVGTGPLPVPHAGHPHSIDVTLPPLAAVVFRHESAS